LNSGLILSSSNAKTLEGLRSILSKKENVKENPVVKKTNLCNSVQILVIMDGVSTKNQNLKQNTRNQVIQHLLFS
jgi:hypothetical protein